MHSDDSGAPAPHALRPDPAGPVFAVGTDIDIPERVGYRIKKINRW